MPGSSPERFRDFQRIYATTFGDILHTMEISKSFQQFRFIRAAKVLVNLVFEVFFLQTLKPQIYRGANKLQMRVYLPLSKIWRYIYLCKSSVGVAPFLFYLGNKLWLKCASLFFPTPGVTHPWVSIFISNSSLFKGTSSPSSFLIPEYCHEQSDASVSRGWGIWAEEGGAGED